MFKKFLQRRRDTLLIADHTQQLLLTLTEVRSTYLTTDGTVDHSKILELVSKIQTIMDIVKDAPHSNMTMITGMLVADHAASEAIEFYGVSPEMFEYPAVTLYRPTISPRTHRLLVAGKIAAYLRPEHLKMLKEEVS